MNYKILFIIALLIGFFFGCSHPEVKVVYKEVMIPVACDVKKPDKPALKDDPVVNMINLSAYIRKLEHSLSICLKRD